MSVDSVSYIEGGFTNRWGRYKAIWLITEMNNNLGNEGHPVPYSIITSLYSPPLNSLTAKLILESYQGLFFPPPFANTDTLKWVRVQLCTQYIESLAASTFPSTFVAHVWY